MRKALGLLGATALTVALVVGPAGAAGTKTGCKGKWTDAGVCSFTYEGGDFSISASGTGGDPATIVSIRLEAAGPVDGSRVLLLSCGISAGGPGAPAACASSSSGGTTPAVYEPQPGDKLVCSVQGNGAGKYRCASGL